MESSSDEQVSTVVEEPERKESDEVLESLSKDKRYSYAMKEEAMALLETEDEDQLDKVLSRSVMERQAEARRERTDVLIQRYQEKEVELTKRRLLYRFRAMGRIMMMAHSLRNYGSDYFERMQGIERIPETPSALPAFDLSLYRRQKQTQVPSQVKRMMGKPTWLRTDEELNLIFRSICELHFFDKYPQATLRKMAPVINYQYVEPNRVVLRQGHMPICFYFILSGSLLVHVDEKDLQGKPTTRQVSRMEAGTSFGELALIHNTPRTATVTTQYGSELLYVEKEDFDVLLKDAAQHEWLTLYNSLTQMPEFSPWTKEQREHCSNNSRLIKFENNKVITGNVCGRPEHIYFIADGKCRVVESLRLVASMKASGGVTLSQVPASSKSKDALLAHSTFRSTVVRRFLHIMTLTKGQYFGCGEDLLQRYVVAWGKAECLQIPHAYLQRYGHASWTELLEDRMHAQVPSHKSVFDEFVQRATWRAYKKDLIAELNQRSKKSFLATMKDVPVSIRYDEQIENWNTIQMT